MSVVWLAQTVRDRRPCFRVGREGDRLLAEWPGVGTLTVDRGGEHPHFAAVGPADSPAVRKLQAGAVPALLRHLRGQVTLHASAVAVGDWAAAFVGESGAGKSTLACALSRTTGGPYALLSDDCLSIVRGLALPGDDATWVDGPAKDAIGLHDDRAKSPVSALRVGQKPAPLRFIVQLAFGETTRVTRLRGGAVLGVLARAMIRFVVDEPDVHRTDMESLLELAANTEVLELQRPKGLEHLASTTSALDRILC
jgi:hypothetical protein